MKILIIGTLPSSLYNFRGKLIEELVGLGAHVSCAASNAKQAEVVKILEIADEYYDYSVERSGINPFKDFKSIIKLFKIFRLVHPDIVISYTIKPVVWSGLICYFYRGIRFFPIITGLGYAFSGGGFFKSVLKTVAKNLYRAALNKSELVFFQNSDNKSYFISKKLVDPDKTRVVNGSGVDLNHFKKKEFIYNGKFLMIARLLKEKGVFEFIEVASLVKAKYPECQFNLIGPFDPSPDGISRELILEAHSRGAINYLGEQPDVRPFIEDCSVFVLPSYHEGMPRTVLEAMAIGRPIITTNVSGCKETVIDRLNGILVEKADVISLYDAIVWSIENKESLAGMCEQSHKLALSKFDVNLVNESIINYIGIKNEKDI